MIAGISSLLIGLVFGAGLAVSGMMNPEKVIGFLDFSGNWDPTLALVMSGALMVTVPGFAIARRRRSPLLAEAFQIPARRDIDRRLIGGAALFGIGWGMAGFCPGPALAALSTGMVDVFAFVGAMIFGMVLHKIMPSK